MAVIAKFCTNIKNRPNSWSVKLCVGDSVNTTVSKTLENDSRRTLKIYHRNGMLENLTPSHTASKDELIVKEVRVLPYRDIEANINEIKRRLDTRSGLFSCDMSRVDELFKLVANNPSKLALEFTINYAYDLSKALDTNDINGDTLAPCHIMGDMAIVDAEYTGELDLSLLDSQDLDVERAKALHNTENLSGVNFEIVDNNHIVEKRYVVLANKPIPLVPVMNTDREDGLYITVSRKNQVIESEFIPLKEKEKWEDFGVYEKEETARSHFEAGMKSADITSAELKERERKLDILREENKAQEIKTRAVIEKLEAELRVTNNKTDAEERKLAVELELEQLRMEHNKLKLESERESIERDKQLEILKAKMEKLKLKRADKHHSRSVDRENSISITKTAAALTIAAITVVVAVVKWVSSGFSLW